MGVALGSGGQVHHAIELQVLAKYPGAFSATELNNLNNMRGIPAELNAAGQLDKVSGRKQLHNSFIRYEWDRLYKMLDAEITAKKLKRGSAEYKALVRSWLKDGALQVDYLVGQFFSENKIKLYNPHLKKITTLSSAAPPTSTIVPPEFIDESSPSSGTKPAAAKPPPIIAKPVPEKPVTTPDAVKPTEVKPPPPVGVKPKDSPTAPKPSTPEPAAPRPITGTPSIDSRHTFGTSLPPSAKAPVTAPKPATVPTPKVSSHNAFDIETVKPGSDKVKEVKFKNARELFKPAKFIIADKLKKLGITLFKGASGMLGSYLLGKIKEYFQGIIAEGKANFNEAYPYYEEIRGSYFEDFQTESNYYTNHKWLEENIFQAFICLAAKREQGDSTPEEVLRFIRETKGKLRSVIGYYENEALLIEEMHSLLVQIEASNIGSEVGERLTLLYRITENVEEIMGKFVDPFNILLDIWVTFKAIRDDMGAFSSFISDRVYEYEKKSEHLEKHQEKYSELITNYMGYLNNYFLN
ncbi:MAG TPA: hypothetical protein PKN75_15235 [Bacteroidia bacterium]|nr:hypothetical protein [Bacteroidia bacterium]